MWAYAIRRVAATIPVMLLVAFFIFGLLHLAGGDPALVLGGDNATPEQIAAIKRDLGLDQPVLIRFGIWLWGIVQGDLGTSLLTRLPVMTLIGQRFEATLSLTLFALILSAGVSIPLGVMAAWQPNSIWDRLVNTIAVAGFSIPVFVLSYIVIYVFALKLRWFPVQGFTSISSGFWPFFQAMFLPALALSLVFMGWIGRVTRDSTAEVIRQDYVRTATAKGGSSFRVLSRHVLRNAAVPIVTVVGMAFASLMGGVVVTETVFAIPGLGRLTVDAIGQRDYPVIQGVVLMMSFIYILVNLLVDLSYVIFDPRIRY